MTTMLRGRTAREVSSDATATGTSNHSTARPCDRRGWCRCSVQTLVGGPRRCYDDAVPMATVRVLLIVGAVGGLTAWAVAQGAAVPAGAPAGTSAVRAQASGETADRGASVTAVDPALDVEID